MASKVLQPEGRALTFRAKATWSVAWTDAAKHSAGLVGQHGDKVMLSNWRNPPSPGEKSAEQGSRITGDTGKSWTARDTAGSVVAVKRSNVRKAKRPCCLQWL